MSLNGSSQEVIDEIRDDFNRLRGRLFGAIEVTGMQEQQQAAFKGLVRQITYASQADLEAIVRRKGH